MKKKYMVPKIYVCVICTSQILAFSDRIRVSDEDANDEEDMI